MPARGHSAAHRDFRHGVFDFRFFAKVSKLAEVDTMNSRAKMRDNWFGAA